jgi:hypothetical protein
MAPTASLPNLSSLKLSLDVDDTGIQVNSPTVPDDTEERYHEDVYDDSLFGPVILHDIAAAIENNEVLVSFRSSAMYETFQGGMAFHTRLWWLNWQHLVNKQKIGEGGHNKAYLVSGADMPPAEFFTAGYGMPPPPRGLIIRTATIQNKPPTKVQTLKEMVTASYARLHGFGPTIFAQFYLTTKEEVMNFQRSATMGGLDDSNFPGPWDTRVPDFIDPGRSAGQLGLRKTSFVCTISEAWEGDCVKKMNGYPEYAQEQFDPTLFAKVFVRLIAKAADAGFWHMDIKRANLLHRTTATEPLELIYTDFDGYFCKILAPGIRTDTRHCCIAATAACFLGEIRCQERRDTWLRFAGPIRDALHTEAGVDLNTIGPMDWCFFLKNVGETRQVQQADGKIVVQREATSWYQHIIGQRLTNHINNYFTDPPDDNPEPGRCFEFVRGRPLFPQVIEFALVTQLP